MAYGDINNTEDIMDSRDVIKRIEDLEAELEDQYDEDEAEELAKLKEFAEEGAQCAPDWEYGETIIRESHFTEYAKQLADDIGAIDANASWPLSFIDWDKAANALKMDYSEIDFDGVTYYVR